MYAHEYLFGVQEQKPKKVFNQLYVIKSIAAKEYNKQQFIRGKYNTRSIRCGFHEENDPSLTETTKPKSTNLTTLASSVKPITVLP